MLAGVVRGTKDLLQLARSTDKSGVNTPVDSLIEFLNKSLPEEDMTELLAGFFMPLPFNKVKIVNRFGHSVDPDILIPEKAFRQARKIAERVYNQKNRFLRKGMSMDEATHAALPRAIVDYDGNMHMARDWNELHHEISKRTLGDYERYAARGFVDTSSNTFIPADVVSGADNAVSRGVFDILNQLDKANITKDRDAFFRLYK
jgi:hypothetical protein